MRAVATLAAKIPAATGADDAAALKKLAKQAGAAAQLMKMLANEKRLLILCFLAVRGEMTVGELVGVVKLSPSALSQHLAKLRADGCDVLVYACTGDFPPLAGDEGVVFPSRVLNGLATGLLPRGRLGILIPLPEQAGKLSAKWARPGLEIVAEALAPSAGAEEAADAARRLASHKPDLVAMDCMSYTPTTKEWVKGPLGVPALLAITATGRVLREMLE